ncbi:MAG: tRNA pseudouridine synthase A [bacterium]|nr:tRNA pseudouridine synthase A [bacterium]
MRRILLTICYDGTRYCGWQVQKNGLSVQSVVQSCLESVVGQLPNGICGCSRTDSGVHANRYCLHFDIQNPIGCKNIVNALNSRLPLDISALDAFEVDADFHARYSCKSKTYIYKIYNSPTRNPFKENYCLRITNDIDIDLINKGCQAFVGTHDFKAFCSAHSAVKTTTRTIYQCYAVLYLIPNNIKLMILQLI